MNNEEPKDKQDLESLIDNYWFDFDEMKPSFSRFDDYEAIILGQPKDKMSQRVRSKITDSLLTTLAIEGTARTIATLPTGKIQAATMQDKGQAYLLDIARQRYVIPNANTQHRFITKIRMFDFYKRVYGNAYMQYDWTISKNGYKGPDCWLIHPRNVITQRGKISKQDWDYVHIDTYVTLPTLEGWYNDKNANYDKVELKKLIDWVKDGKPAIQKTEEQKSWIERERTNDGRLSKGSVKLTTRYEAGKDGRWVTFCPTFGNIIRNIANPHKNSKIPIEVNYSYPLLDHMQSLSDFERGKSLQFARDGITNSFALGFNMSILPPVIVNPNGVIPSTLKYLPNQIWQETQMNSIRRFEVNPQSISTFQNAFNVLTGMQYNQAGTTDTRLTQEGTSDPGFGRSPAAIAKQEKRENSRDNWNRSLTEEAIESLIDSMMGLFGTMQKYPVIVDLFNDEIQIIDTLGYKDLQAMMTVNDKKTYAKMTIPTDFFKEGSYRFYMDSNSTQAEDLQGQREALDSIIEKFNKVPQLAEMLAQQGWKFEMGEAVKKSIVLSGVDNTEDIIHPMNNNDLQTMVQQAIEQGVQQQMQAMQEQAMMQQQQQTGLQTPQANEAMGAILQRFNG